MCAVVVLCMEVVLSRSPMYTCAFESHASAVCPRSRPRPRHPPPPRRGVCIPCWSCGVRVPNVVFVAKQTDLHLNVRAGGGQLRVSDVIVPEGIRFFRGNEPAVSTVCVLCCARVAVEEDYGCRAMCGCVEKRRCQDSSLRFLKGRPTTGVAMPGTVSLSVMVSGVLLTGWTGTSPLRSSSYSRRRSTCVWQTFGIPVLRFHVGGGTDGVACMPRAFTPPPPPSPSTASGC